MSRCSLKIAVLFLLIACLAGSHVHSGNKPWDPLISPWIKSYAPGMKTSTQTMKIYPHIELNDTECVSCHFVNDENPALLPDWAYQTPVDNDDTPYNNLCRHCHNDIEAPFVRTHSSISIDNSYGNWSMECRTCHDPHQPGQLIGYGSDAYLDTGIVGSVSDNVLNTSGMGWADNVYAGYLVVPNTGDVDHVYKIGSNSANTLYVEGPMDLTKVAAGNTFAVILGKNVKSAVTIPAGGSSAVRFFRRTGAKSFADGDGTYDGICEVCHTQTTHFRNNGGGSDPLHTNQDNVPGSRCTTCHSHVYGFRHGGGGGAGCGTGSTCHGLRGSHPTHVGGSGMQLALACSDCHNASSIPLFADNQTLANTTACNTCHSPGGTYNGVSDLNIGAKNNWSARVYGADNLLKSGKEKWCASCHDETPSVIGGVSAPNVVGSESGSYPYGTGWGYYKTGHGLPADQAYASKGGLFPPLLVGGSPPRPLGCDTCHDFTTRHIDNVARTYGTQGVAQGAYRQGYRLKRVNGLEPLVIPRLASQNNDNSYLLCVQCHYSNVFYNSTDTNTNMRNGGTNYHRYHLNYNNNSAWKSDWRSTGNSAISCTQCHNVHGSTRMAMVNDGSLAGTPPGIVMYYYNTTLSFRDSGDLTAPPIPLGLPLALRDGTTFYGNTVYNAGCTASCHTSANRLDRAYATMTGQVFNVAPTLAWTGETGYTADGVSPDSAASGSRFTFRVNYSDNNNNLPSSIRVLLDTNNDGSFEEAYAMAAADNVAGNTYHGRIYTKTLTITNIGSSTMRYKFDAADNAALAATGPPTSENTLTLLNNAPVLSWTGEANYVTDGVNPNVGGSGATFTFRVKYTDADGDCPDGNGVSVVISGTTYALDPEAGACGTGRIYSKAVPIVAAGDYTYRFTATDAGGSAATGDPVSNHTVTVLSSANTPPVLDWVSEGCRTDGVKPALGLTNGDFEFKVNYTDIGNQCPASGSANIQVWIDLDDSGTYEPGERFNLTEEAAGGCTTGKIYKVTRQIPYAGNGVLTYRFYASNGTVDAIGDPATTDKSLTVVSSATTTGVRTTGGSAPWYATIQAGVDAAPQNGTVLVYPGTYTGRIWLNNTAPIDTGKTVRSVCGPDLTVTTSGSGTLDSVYLQADGVTIDGFGITGGRYGVYASGSTYSYTIKNCKIYNSAVNYNGIYSQSSQTATVDNTEIFSNTANAPGAGLRVSSATSLVLSNSYIHNNTSTSASGDGGGLYLDIVTNASISNTVISGNTTARDGGGVGIMTNSNVVFDRVTITGNTATAKGGGINAVSGSTITINNSLIANNTAGTNGGALYPTLNPVVVNNSTIAFNRASSGGGIYWSDIRTVTEYIRNSILWGNSASGNGQTMYINLAPASGATLHISDSIMPDDNDGSNYNYPYFNSPKGVDTSGNMSYNDPFFVYPEGRDYHLQSVSPAIDHANPATATSYDLDNVARTQGAGPDIGAYEYQAGGSGPARSPSRRNGIAVGTTLQKSGSMTPEEYDRNFLSDTASPITVYPAP
ncbi:MAG: hypothetical protein HZB63_09725 [Deltaproteobacteria bacterium]|nr:hypothetical protein [Deltaproteobacteria bacterium]